MTSRTLRKFFKSLSSIELTQGLEKDEAQAVYILMQVLRILATTIWVFSNITCFFIGVLLNSESSLFEWGIHHKYWVVLTITSCLYIPATITFFALSRIEPAKYWDQGQPSKSLSPKNVWIIIIFITSLTIPFLAFIVSFIAI